MSNKKRKGWIWGLILAVVIVVGPVLYNSVVPTLMNPSTEEVRKELKNYLYKKYGEEFIVDRIGTRKDDGTTEYVARIYPKSIIGTKKEGDEYYYGSASIDKGSFGKLERPGDNYSYIKMNLGAENYLRPKAKEIFGDKIRLKVDSKIKIWGREEIIVEAYREKGDKDSTGVDAFIGYKESNFKKARKRVLEDPEHNRLFLELYVYVFDRIENQAEKEKRRKDIFEFVHYLKKESLFKYLELRVKFIDERVLAPSYWEYKEELNYVDKVKKKVGGKKVYLPPLKFRKKMSEVLQTEVKKMSKEKLINNMNKIKKSYLNFDEIGKYDEQYSAWIASIAMLKADPTIVFEKYKENNDLRKHDYDKLTDIKLLKDDKYIYLN